LEKLHKKKSKAPPRKCLHCEKLAICRGLCSTDYNAANHLIRAKKVTWEKLVKAKKALPSREDERSERQAWFLEKKSA
jgi:predicted lipoprotein